MGVACDTLSFIEKKMSEFLNRATESLGSTVLPQNRQTFTFMVAIAPLYDCSIRSIHAVCARERRYARGSPDTTSVNLLRGMNTCDLYFYGHFYGKIYGKRGACSVYQAFLSPPLEGLGTRLIPHATKMSSDYKLI